MERIDPFDGGPHFEADTADISLIRKFRTLKVADGDFDMEGDDVLVAVESDTGRNRFRSVRCQARLENTQAFLPARAKEVLDIQPGSKVSIIPFE